MYYFLNIILIIITLTMGIVLLIIPIPVSKGMKSYKISLKILSIAYLTIAFLNFIQLFFDSVEKNPEYFGFLNLLISSLQTILFSFTLITLLNPQFITRKKVFLNLLPILISLFLFTVSYLIYGDCVLNSIYQISNCTTLPTLIIRFLFFLFFVAQIVYFSILFYRAVEHYKNQLKNYFSETSRLELHWVKYAFISALVIGLLALSFQIYPHKIFDLIFPIILSFFYFIFAVKYINYNKLYTVIDTISEQDHQNLITNLGGKRSKFYWENYKKNIIEEKYYLQEGITLDEIALKLKISRATLSNLINKEENVNFNCFINRLRIEESQKILLKNPHYSFLTVAEMIGYSEHSNFSRQFKLTTGVSPSVWLKNNLNS